MPATRRLYSEKVEQSKSRAARCDSLLSERGANEQSKSKLSGAERGALHVGAEQSGGHYMYGVNLKLNSYEH